MHPSGQLLSVLVHHHTHAITATRLTTIKMATVPFPLPAEILLEIVGYLYSDVPSFKSFMQTCRFTHHTLEKMLYTVAMRHSDYEFYLLNAMRDSDENPAIARLLDHLPLDRLAETPSFLYAPHALRDRKPRSPDHPTAMTKTQAPCP